MEFYCHTHTHTYMYTHLPQTHTHLFKNMDTYIHTHVFFLLKSSYLIHVFLQNYWRRIIGVTSNVYAIIYSWLINHYQYLVYISSRFSRYSWRNVLLLQRIYGQHIPKYNYIRVRYTQVKWYLNNIYSKESVIRVTYIHVISYLKSIYYKKNGILMRVYPKYSIIQHIFISNGKLRKVILVIVVCMVSLNLAILSCYNIKLEIVLLTIWMRKIQA